MSVQMRIRPAETRDLHTIVRFNAAMALESEAVTLDEATLRAGVAALLSDATKGFYLIAEIAAEPAGQLMVTFEWSDWRNGWMWWIQSVYVTPQRRRQGVYRNLYRRLQELATDQGNVRGVRLYVMRENVNAKRTYEAMGMAHSEYDLYETEL